MGGQLGAVLTADVRGGAAPADEPVERGGGLIGGDAARDVHLKRLAGELVNDVQQPQRVADAAGNAAEATRTVLVDSTETLGSAVVGPGARGADARRLLRLLRRYGGLDGAAWDAIGPSAVRSVRAFQRRKGSPWTGSSAPTCARRCSGGCPVASRSTSRSGA